MLLEQFHRGRPLHGHHHGLHRHVIERDLAPLGVLLEMRDDLGPVARVADDQEVLLVARNDHVVEHTALLVADVTVARSTDLELLDVSRADELQERLGVVSADEQTPHVRHVEDAAGGTRVQVFLLHAPVHDRHLPTTKINQTCPQTLVCVEQCGA